VGSCFMPAHVTAPSITLATMAANKTYSVILLVQSSQELPATQLSRRA
jgi:hypothetical protein